MDTEVIKNIEELFKKWYYKIFIDSTGRMGHEERDELMKYCSEHLEEFKEFAKDTLEHPYEWNHHIPGMCNELLPDAIPGGKLNEEETYNLIKKLQEEMLKGNEYREKWIWEGCNIWLNYFKGTKDVDYYKDYVEYKEYLHRHFIGWSPNKEEDDPNPTYEEFLANREKYKI